MSEKIKFCRMYNKFGTPHVDVIYQNKVLTCIGLDSVPKTAKKFIETAPFIKEQYDKLLDGYEWLYSHEELT